MRRRGLAAFMALAAGLAAGPLVGQGMPAGEDGPVRGGPVLFLVRHAETAPDGTRDPALSPEGRERANELASLLADAGIAVIYTTDYRRTRATAGAVGRGLGLEAQLYDPRNLGAFVDSLLARGERALVVGHSNTTPELVAALGGAPGSPIEETEHSRLYVVVPAGAGGAAWTAVLRY